ncbi:unnamed protein product [Pleuronectes platessa]|uniref:Uncharacterized protein n=1 Tax=Pleuronectes platessa TaxID=8262 RepID=A0A9N7YMX2_PLEPL|nr:unnamed protein product [Pleuronectes platessa]
MREHKHTELYSESIEGRSEGTLCRSEYRTVRGEGEVKEGGKGRARRGPGQTWSRVQRSPSASELRFPMNPVTFTLLSLLGPQRTSAAGVQMSACLRDAGAATNPNGIPKHNKSAGGWPQQRGQEGGEHVCKATAQRRACIPTA